MSSELPGEYNSSELMLAKTLILNEDHTCTYSMEGDLFVIPETTNGKWINRCNRIIIETDGSNYRFKKRYVFKIKADSLVRHNYIYHKSIE
jgi:hypothetical protein